LGFHEESFSMPAFSAMTTFVFPDKAGGSMVVCNEACLKKGLV